MTEARPFASDDELFQGLLRRLDERACLPGDLLERLVIGALPRAEAAEVQAHLADCLSCLSAFSRIHGLHESSQPRPRLVGDSPSARALRAELNRLTSMDEEQRAPPPVLVVGEIGTGKGIVARAVHDLSRRASRAFVEVQCAAMSASRLELELFGSERGASPEAAASGLFGAAGGGTLFLDDIDALSRDLQGKLLAALDAEPSFDVRIVAATHADLADAARRGAFRADLLDRFARSTLTIAPLRERPDDIVPLARYFAGQFARHRGWKLRLTTDAEERLRRYRWPGNVRALSDVIERVARRRGREEIGAEELELPRA